MDEDSLKQRQRETKELSKGQSKVPDGSDLYRASQDPSAEDVARQLRDGLHLLDTAIHVTTPSAAWFDQHIAATRSKRKSMLMRDLAILWIGAMFLFYVFYLTVTAQPVAFLSIQVAAILIPLAWLILRKQVASHDDN
ncbi:YxlC family protein [Paenibacillus sp. LjRoot153]|uniref:YxlC family protein n=1 Tax=Paenibacillus sp. LjRoot153 TaxID=3342270 RepID=UPI003ECD5144